ncbi:copper amine oxidase [Trichoderma austrokoningii]
MASHPFDPLSPEEIQKAASIVRPCFAGQDPNFRFITLKKPPKKHMIAFLDHRYNGTGTGTTTTRPARQARVQVIASPAPKEANQLFELIVDLDTQSVVKLENLKGKHSFIDSSYMGKVEKACLADARVQAEIQTLRLPDEAVVCVEAWAYATDGMIDMTERITMCWFYMRLTSNPDANYYAYPLDICAEVDEKLRVIQVYRLPASSSTGNEARPYDRSKIHPATHSEYHPSLRSEYRQTTKPYQVVQPDSPSFKVDGNAISWEKWTLHVGFNYREGLTLHDVRYDGRSLFYRLSLAEMFVPYGDPRSPYQRKGAFDLGNDGAGINANNLQLGCDCLGTIRYFDGWHNTRSGEPLRMPNVVCCHEQDDGILWKHTNFRTKQAVVTRSRVLVLQTIITVSNYEYIFAFHLGQDASIQYEVRATGILSTVPIAVGETVPFGTVVAPGVLAPYHQHLFCLRIDPAIDGHANSLLVEESRALPVGDDNPLGVGYVTSTEVVDHEQGLDLDFATNRTFKIVNEKVVNPVTGTPVGFKIVPCYSQMLLAHPTSHHARRSEYGQHAIWVTRYDDDEFFPAGRHTMQSPGGDGIASAIERRRKDASADTSVRDEDIVVWHTFGSTHNPWIEDWPVMPAEKMAVGLKPVNFFARNPGLDVAVSTQEQNRSCLVKR